MTQQPASPDDHLAALDRSIPIPEDQDLALRHAPRIRFDKHEPFFPSVVGYTVFRGSVQSPSFPRDIVLKAPAVTAIEYAIWWDWDIQHLYELEHIWVYLDVDENLVDAEASWHGGYHRMADENGRIPLEDGRLVVCSEPGKHAFAPSPAWLMERAPVTRQSCGREAGKMGVHVTPLFDGIIDQRTPLHNRLVHTYMERSAFEPAFEFTNVFALETAHHVPWKALFAWIPERVAWWCQHLNETIPPHKRRVLRIAHRGASAHAQENSLAALLRAAEQGADMIEADVRVTADDVPVIAHDPTLSRVYGIDTAIADLTLDELQAITASSGSPIMTLADALKACQEHGLALYLDIKALTEKSGKTMIDLLKQQSYLPYTIFGAFQPDLAAEIKVVEPKAITSILFHSTHIDPVALARAVGCDYVHPCWEHFDRPDQLLTEAWIKQVRDAGLGIVCWHEERPPVIAGLQALGVDAICSDEPELLLPR